MLERILVEERSSPDLRCSLCHDGEGRLESCPTCGTVFHGACRAQDRRCPTLGCSERHGRIGPIGVATREGPEPSWSLLVQALAVSFATATLAIVAIIFGEMVSGGVGTAAVIGRLVALALLLLHFFFAPGTWAALRRGTRSRRRAVGVTIGAIGTMIPVAVLLLWLAPGVASIGVAMILLFFGPAVGAWLGASTSDDDAPSATSA